MPVAMASTKTTLGAFHAKRAGTASNEPRRSPRPIADLTSSDPRAERRRSISTLTAGSRTAKTTKIERMLNAPIRPNSRTVGTGLVTFERKPRIVVPETIASATPTPASAPIIADCARRTSSR